MFFYLREKVLYMLDGGLFYLSEDKFLRILLCKMEELIELFESCFCIQFSHLYGGRNIKEIVQNSMKLLLFLEDPLMRRRIMF